MPLLWRGRSCRSGFSLVTLLSFTFWSMASVFPPGVQGAVFPVGLATGSKEAQIMLDGRPWATLGGPSTPVFDGTMLRTGNGVALVLLNDGTQLELQPRSVLTISGSRLSLVIKVANGRVLFNLPSSTSTVLVTPAAHYSSPASSLRAGRAAIRVAAGSANPGSSDQVGEIVVTQRGGSRIGLMRGEMIARPLNESGLHVVKAGQSVTIPKIGDSDPSSAILLAQALPGEASTQPIPTVPLYDQPGKSIGYCRLDGTFVPAPGITYNLKAPVPPSKIPAIAIPADAPPVFTADPDYAGYLSRDELAEPDPPQCDCPIPVYDPPGKSIGYIDTNGSFVSSPGYTPDLTNAVSPNTIPPGVTIPPDGTPIFTVEPAYVGYLQRDEALRDKRLRAAFPLHCRIAAVFFPVAGAPAGIPGWGLAPVLVLLGGGVAGAVALSQGGTTASQFVP